MPYQLYRFRCLWFMVWTMHHVRSHECMYAGGGNTLFLPNTKGNPWVPGVDLHLLVIRSYILDYHSNTYFEDTFRLQLRSTQSHVYFLSFTRSQYLTFRYWVILWLQRNQIPLLNKGPTSSFTQNSGLLLKAIFEELVIVCPDSHLSYSRVCEWAAFEEEDYLLKMTFDQAPNLRFGRTRISLELRLLLMRTKELSRSARRSFRRMTLSRKVIRSVKSREIPNLPYIIMLFINLGV